MQTKTTALLIPRHTSGSQAQLRLNVPLTFQSAVSRTLASIISYIDNNHIFLSSYVLQQKHQTSFLIFQHPRHGIFPKQIYIFNCKITKHFFTSNASSMSSPLKSSNFECGDFLSYPSPVWPTSYKWEKLACRLFSTKWLLVKHDNTYTCSGLNC